MIPRIADFGETIDPPTEDVTAHMIELLAATVVTGTHPAISGAVDLPPTRSRSPTGSWCGTVGREPHLRDRRGAPRARGSRRGHDRAPRATVVDWLAACQNADGGWGERIDSYRYPAWIGRGESTASQTAWALLGLLAADREHPAVAGGVRWLTGHQSPNGEWLEDAFTGTGFPGDFMIKYHYYRLYFPLTALGRYLS